MMHPLQDMEKSDHYVVERREKSETTSPKNISDCEYPSFLVQPRLESTAQPCELSADMFSYNCPYFTPLDAVSEERSLEFDYPVRRRKGYGYGNEENDAEESSSSSSLSNDSSDSQSSTSSTDDELGELEVESSFIRGPLDSLSSLEDSLPIKRGLSRFFNGKSRSFDCLADVRSIEDIPKPENPHAKRRKSLSCLGGNPDKTRFHPPRSSVGISKKPPLYNNPKSKSVSFKWQTCLGPSSRSSLSDLQRAGCQFSPGKV